MIPKKLISEIERWIKEGRYGNIQINFSAGKIVNYNVTQSLRVEMVFSTDDATKASADTGNDIIEV